MGFKRFDVVRHLGKEYIIKGRQSLGYAYLMDKDQKEVKFKPIPKFELLARVRARKCWIIF